MTDSTARSTMSSGTSWFSDKERSTPNAKALSSTESGMIRCPVFPAIAAARGIGVTVSQ
ncbi:hypothetical protein [Massilia aquatica]|uniref:hypothetical protein n=1 Tax=Massilia aquatica TaxID=2609000 RepID=UPI0014238E41|nr:hypothetical protein [Massilia aquatica]